MTVDFENILPIDKATHWSDKHISCTCQELKDQGRWSGDWAETMWGQERKGNGNAWCIACTGQSQKHKKKKEKHKT